MRVSKFPYRNFEFNMERAEALARLDGYLADLLHEKGKGTIQPLLEIPNELQQAFHIKEIMDRVKKRIEEELKNEIKAEYEQKGKEHFEKIAKEYTSRRLKPRFQRIAVIFRNLELLSNQTLLEQSLVAGVSAFEVYLRELVASSMMLNPSIMRGSKQKLIVPSAPADWTTIDKMQNVLRPKSSQT